MLRYHVIQYSFRSFVQKLDALQTEEVKQTMF